jgi:hypothetical protein
MEKFEPRMDWLKELERQGDVVLVRKFDTACLLLPKELIVLLEGGTHLGWNMPEAWLVESAKEHLASFDRRIADLRKKQIEFANRMGVVLDVGASIADRELAALVRRG